MENKYLREIPLAIIALAPVCYLAYIWSSLPESLPMHYGADGRADRYGSRAELVLIPFMVSFLPYFLLLVIPHLDPKGRIDKSSGKFKTLRLFLTVILSGLALFIMHTAAKGDTTMGNELFLLLGVLFVVLGNYFKTLKPNYFIGIRTPWTLENEQVWKDTHVLGGKVWLAGGLLIILLSLILESEFFSLVFIGIILVLALIPAIYSYKRFRELKKPL